MDADDDVVAADLTDQRIEWVDVVCADCGALVAYKRRSNRVRSIERQSARARVSLTRLFCGRCRFAALGQFLSSGLWPSPTSCGAGGQ